MIRTLWMALFALCAFIAPAQASKLPPLLDPAGVKEHILDRKGFVILEGWAYWCEACVQALPHLEEFHAKNGDVVPVYMIDFDEHKEFVKSIGIERLPTFLLFYDGVAIDKITTVPSFGSLSRWVNRHARKLGMDNVVPHVPRNPNG